MKKIIYIFYFSLTINIQASHPFAEQDFYQPIVNLLENPLCLLDEELNPFLNPDFSKELYQTHEKVWREQIKVEELQTSLFLMTTYTQEQRNNTPSTPNRSITNSSIGHATDLYDSISITPKNCLSESYTTTQKAPFPKYKVWK